MLNSYDDFTPMSEIVVGSAENYVGHDRDLTFELFFHEALGGYRSDWAYPRLAARGSGGQAETWKISKRYTEEREQAAQPVGESGDLAGQVVIEPDDHVELGDGLVVQLDRAECVEHGAGGVRDDCRVAGVGFAFTGVEVGDPPHRQAGQIGDLAARVAGDGQRQGTDRGGLVDDGQHLPVLGRELVEHGPHLRLAVGQRLVDDALAVRCEAGGVVFALADVEAEEHGDVASVDHFTPPGRVRPASTVGGHTSALIMHLMGAAGSGKTRCRSRQ
jgi:predicted RNA-binding protein with PUA domain